MNRQRTLLALTADLAGAAGPRLLASLLAELGAEGAIEPTRTRVVAGAGGPLAGALPAASVRVLGPAADVGGRLLARATPRARPVGDRLGMAWGVLRHPAPARSAPPDVVWAHGAGALRLAAALPGPARRAPLVAHVHELGVGLRRALHGAAAGPLLARADVVVAASDAVRAHLVDDLGVAGERVVVHRPWVPASGPVAPRRPDGVPPDALVVAGSGPVGWRAGTDLFAELARRLPAEVGGRPVHLVWVGDADRPGDDRRAAADVALRNVAGRVHLVGDGHDPGPWLAGADLVAVTSREEPFPLAALEAGARGIPSVALACGGVAEALPAGSLVACLAPALDVAGLAERAGALLADDRARRSHGGDLRARVLQDHAAAPAVRDLWADVCARLAQG